MVASEIFTGFAVALVEKRRIKIFSNGRQIETKNLNHLFLKKMIQNVLLRMSIGIIFNWNFYVKIRRD